MSDDSTTSTVTKLTSKVIPKNKCVGSSSVQSELNENEQDGPFELVPLGGPIPPVIHHIWFGGAMSLTAMKNISDWAGKAREAGNWFVMLWTDSRINFAFKDKVNNSGETLEEQFKQLERVKVVKLFDLAEVSVFDEGTLDEIYRQVIMQAIQKVSTSPLPCASDMARYCILNSHGGVYIDVDIGPGKLKLPTEPLEHYDGRSEVPHLGTPWRDGMDFKKMAHHEWQDRTEGEVRIYTLSNVPNNNFIATRAGALFLQILLGMIGNSSQALEEIDRHTAAMVTGPLRLIRALDTAMKELGGKGEDEVSELRVTPWIEDLDWITDDS